MSYCPTDPCIRCERTLLMKLCFNSFTVDGLNPSEAVELRFENKADNAILYANGTTDGNGTLTIAVADMPSFVAGVHYRLTSPSYDWCYIVTFEHRITATGWVTGTDETLTPCN